MSLSTLVPFGGEARIADNGEGVGRRNDFCINSIERPTGRALAAVAWSSKDMPTPASSFTTLISDSFAADQPGNRFGAPFRYGKTYLDLVAIQEVHGMRARDVHKSRPYRLDSRQYILVRAVKSVMVNARAHDGRRRLGSPHVRQPRGRSGIVRDVERRTPSHVGSVAPHLDRAQ